MVLSTRRDVACNTQSCCSFDLASMRRSATRGVTFSEPDVVFLPKVQGVRSAFEANFARAQRTLASGPVTRDTRSTPHAEPKSQPHHNREQPVQKGRGGHAEETVTHHRASNARRSRRHILRVQSLPRISLAHPVFEQRVDVWRPSTVSEGELSQNHPTPARESAQLSSSTSSRLSRGPAPTFDNRMLHLIHTRERLDAGWRAAGLLKDQADSKNGNSQHRRQTASPREGSESRSAVSTRSASAVAFLEAETDGEKLLSTEEVERRTPQILQVVHPHHVKADTLLASAMEKSMGSR
jgi:hypothetical protein